MTNNIVASHEALRKTYRPGQQWQCRSHLTGYEWRDRPGEPGWFLDTEYRIKPETQTDMESTNE